MTGGTWVTQNKVRPGVYMNFTTKAKALGTLSERGIVAFPAPLPWGNAGLIELEAATYADQARELLGFNVTDARIRHITAAVSQANKVLIYRLGGVQAVKAKATEGTLTATAKHGGTRGNDLTITVQVHIDEPSLFEVITRLDNEVVDRQTIGVIEELMDTAFVDWSGTGAPTPIAALVLSGGANGEATGSDLSDALLAFEGQEFNVLGLPMDDLASKKLVVSFMKRIREEEGKKAVAVVVDYADADYEGIISLKNSIVTSDGLKVEPVMLLWEIAAMEAGAHFNESLTYQAIPNAVDAYPRLTNSETIQALKKGELVLTAMNGRVVIEQDINTLTSFTPDHGKAFAKNRVVRVLDSIANDIKQIFSTYYVGKVSNHPDGRDLLKSEVMSYLNTLVELGAIQGFDAQSDLVIAQGAEADAVVISLSVQPVDSIEKIYMTVEVV